MSQVPEDAAGGQLKLECTFNQTDSTEVQIDAPDAHGTSRPKSGAKPGTPARPKSSPKKPQSPKIQSYAAGRPASPGEVVMLS